MKSCSWKSQNLRRLKSCSRCSSRRLRVNVPEICRKMGISKATFYNWKRNLGVGESRRLRQLEEENAKLKQIIADLTLDKQILQDVLKKALKIMQRRQLARYLIDSYRIPAKRAFKVVLLARSLWYYKPHRRDDQIVRWRINEIAATRIRYGAERIFILLRREGWSDDFKRVYRICREEGLNLRSKRPRRNRASAHRLERPGINGPYQVCSMVF